MSRPSYLKHWSGSTADSRTTSPISPASSTYSHDSSISENTTYSTYNNSTANPPIPTTRPATTVPLPPKVIAHYQALLSLPPTSPLIAYQLSSFPRVLIKKEYRKPVLLSRLTTPLRRLSQFVAGPTSQQQQLQKQHCDLCPLHHRLLEAPLVHLAGLLGYEMYTHLQSLTALHPAQRHSRTNDLLAALHPWRERRFLEPGTRVEGCLACAIGALYNDFEAMNAIVVLARSGHRRGDNGVPLLKEGWLGWWAEGKVKGRQEAMEDRQAARATGVRNREWIVKNVGQGDVPVLSTRPLPRSSARDSRHSDRSSRSSGSYARSEHPMSPPMSPMPRIEAEDESEEDVKPILFPMKPVRPDRPKGLTLFKHTPEDLVRAKPKEEEPRTLRSSRGRGMSVYGNASDSKRSIPNEGRYEDSDTITPLSRHRSTRSNHESEKPTLLPRKASVRQSSAYSRPTRAVESIAFSAIPQPLNVRQRHRNPSRPARRPSKYVNPFTNEWEDDYESEDQYDEAEWEDASIVVPSFVGPADDQTDSDYDSEDEQRTKQRYVAEHAQLLRQLQPTQTSERPRLEDHPAFRNERPGNRF
ncbi:MAG: hypothetical protein LQ350_003451 [Teloschistes chrysophthalmus]|nr:MAG: hypothetical protein LQ350_003451 [Niorma chrysophthalma]